MRISVCIATYNGEKFIKQQLDSIICQLSENDEIIISDDGSIDNTINIISSYADPRIKIFHHTGAKNQNYKHTSYHVTKNFENALSHSTGDYIFLSDQDDIWVNTKIEEVITLFKEQNLNLIIHNAELIDMQTNKIADSYFNIVKSKAGFVKNLHKNSYLGCCMAFDKNVLIKSLPFPKDLIAHDIWIGLIAERIGYVAFIDKKLIKYRRHESTVSTSGGMSQNSFIFKIKYRIQFIFQYSLRLIL